MIAWLLGIKLKRVVWSISVPFFPFGKFFSFFYSLSYFSLFRDPACVNVERDERSRGVPTTSTTSDSIPVPPMIRSPKPAAANWNDVDTFSVVFSTVSFRSEAASCRSLNLTLLRELARFCQVSAGLSHFSPSPSIPWNRNQKSWRKRGRKEFAIGRRGNKKSYPDLHFPAISPQPPPPPPFLTPITSSALFMYIQRNLSNARPNLSSDAHNISHYFYLVLCPNRKKIRLDTTLLLARGSKRNTLFL